MSNPEFDHINSNDASVNSSEIYVNDYGNGTIGAEQQTTNIIKSPTHNSDVTKVVNEKYKQNQIFGTNMNIDKENNSNMNSSEEMFSNEKHEKTLLQIQSEDKHVNCQNDLQHKGIPEIVKANDSFIGFVTEGKGSEDTKSFDSQSSLNEGCLPSLGIQIGVSSVNPCSDKHNAVQVHKPQPMNSDFKIFPNPNEFNLLDNNGLSMKSPDLFNLNQSTNEILTFSDNSIVISNSNAIPQSDSIVSSNYSLSQLQQYITDDEDDSVVEEVIVAPVQYREVDQQMENSDDDSDSSTSSSTSILISDSSSDSESEDEYENFTNKPVCKPIKAKGEMDVSDLPPIEDLTISVPEEECIPIGKIYQIVDQLVIVQANKDTPAYDLDTVLFTQGGKPLGKVFDVMGPVTEPYYCIRFNSKDHIEEKNISLDQTIYAAPKTQYSKFVFLAQLMQLKGSDASWENDIEPPEMFLDYSDDEQEQRAKKKLHRNKKAVSKPDCDPDEPARKKHSAYVKRMNARNLQLSAARGNQNPNKNNAENGKILWQPNLPPMMSVSAPPARPLAPCHQMFGRPPQFDMRVPPPNSPFPSYGGLQLHRPELPVFPMFPGPSTSSQAQGPLPFPRPSVSPRPMQFSRPCASPGPPPFPRPCIPPAPSNGPRMPPFSPHPSYNRLPSNQSFNSTPHSWNSFPKSDNSWTSPFPPHPPRNGPPTIRNTPPSPIGLFPFQMDFPGSFPNRSMSPQGPARPPQGPWPPQINNQGNSRQYNFNPSVPPPPPKFFHN